MNKFTCFDEAINFFKSMRWDVLIGEDKNPICMSHNKHHPIGVKTPFIGVYHGFDTKQELINYANQLYPNSLAGRISLKSKN